MKNKTSCPPAISFKLWNAAKEARQLRLIDNQEINYLRLIRLLGSKDSITKHYIEILELLYQHKQIQERKQQVTELKQRIKSRLNNLNKLSTINF